jgi:hypothetical protein
MARSTAARNLSTALPTLLALGAIAAVVLGTFMTIKTHRTDQQVSDLERYGVVVTYHVSACSSGSEGGLTCDGTFRFKGSTFSEDIEGILNQPADGADVAALVDPRQPGAYVYVRSAVFGPNAAGRGSWLVGAILLAILALAMALTSYRLTTKRRRISLTSEFNSSPA